MPAAVAFSPAVHFSVAVDVTVINRCILPAVMLRSLSFALAAARAASVTAVAVADLAVALSAGAAGAGAPAAPAFLPLQTSFGRSSCRCSFAPLTTLPIPSRWFLTPTG